jgi:hypothetical protein
LDVVDDGGSVTAIEEGERSMCTKLRYGWNDRESTHELWVGVQTDDCARARKAFSNNKLQNGLEI